MPPLRKVSATAWAAISTLACLPLLGPVGLAQNVRVLMHGPEVLRSPVEIIKSVESVPQDLTLMQIQLWVSGLLALATIVSFLVWVWSAFGRATRLGVRPERSAVSVILGFFVPILCFFWPYLGLRQFDEAIEPELMPEPPPRPAAIEAAPHGYREAAKEKRAERIHAPRPPLGWWWGIWVFHLFAGLFWSWMMAPHDWPTDRLFPIGLELVSDVDAILAIVVILRIEARLRERARRLA
jgi:hypothetical protein